LELVPPLQVRTFAPSWIKTMQLAEIDGVRPAFYKFYTSTLRKSGKTPLPTGLEAILLHP
jgi:hypothetical protein